MTFQPLFPDMWGCTVTAPRLTPRIVLDVLVYESIKPFFEVRPPVMLGLDLMVCQNFLNAIDA